MTGFLRDSAGKVTSAPTKAQALAKGAGQGLNRRHALFAGVTLPLMAALPAKAQAPAQEAPAQEAAAQKLLPLAQQYALGDWVVHPLLAGMSRNDEPRKTFGLNVSDEEFARVSEAAFIPTDWTGGNFVPVVVRTPSDIVLFDTGIAAAGLLAALAQTGIAAAEITVVVLTHMHGDHIGGLLGEDGSLTFPNARYVTGRVEFDHWASAGNEGFDAKVKPLAEQMTFVEAGAEAVSGITSVPAFGHTPGHMAWHLEQGGQRLLLTADTANHYVWSLENPDWEVRFDMDRPKAAETRRQIFGMLAADRIPFIGYHMPFPGLGYVEAAGSGFRYRAHSYQLAVFPK